MSQHYHYVYLKRADGTLELAMNEGRTAPLFCSSKEAAERFADTYKSQHPGAQMVVSDDMKLGGTKA